jgi:LmbE family N-acetylglucosaminyl deacetylase
VAHPDDETLWLSPWLGPEVLVVAALPQHPYDAAVTEARTRIAAEFPVGTMQLLPLQGADVLGRSDRRRRAPTSYGVELASTCPVDARTTYEANYDRLRDALGPIIAANPVVITPNPWGEYGHEEHVQVCHAVLDVAAQHNGCVWAWDGFSTKELADTSMRLRRDFYEPRTAVLPRCRRDVDGALFANLRALYAAENAWTWDGRYEPSATAEFIELMHEGTELLPARRSPRATRELEIAADHLRHLPRAAVRVIKGGSLRR